MTKANLSVRQCHIGYSSIKFLGHIIGKGQLQPHTNKLEKIKDAPRPQTKKQVISFIGLCSYYRRFIPDFAAITAPLTDRTKSKEPNKVAWTDSQELAFNTLKKYLTRGPILRLPDFKRLFILRTDASDVGIGALLLQDYNDNKLPVAYASK